MKIGVLALQGDFDAHRRRLEELGAEVVLVRKPEQFDAIDGLVIPGGESSTFLKLLEEKTLQKLNDLDITIRRNAYGRQIDSAIIEADSAFGGEPLEMVFIRAPRIESVGEGVEVLARRGEEPVLVRKGSVMAATFHPELSDDTRVHAEFLKLVTNGTK